MFWDIVWVFDLFVKSVYQANVKQLISSCSLLLEFLDNFWNFEIFFHSPEKLLEKQIISLYSWKTPGIMWKIFEQFYKQNKTCGSIWLLIVFFFLYFMSRLSFRIFFLRIFIAFYFGWKAEELHNCFSGIVTRYVFCKGEFGAGSWQNKIIFYTLENSWKTPGIFLSSISENHIICFCYVA